MVIFLNLNGLSLKLLKTFQIENFIQIDYFFKKNSKLQNHFPLSLLFAYYLRKTKQELNKTR